MTVEQIDASEWPTGPTSRLMILTLEPDELSRRLGIVFEDDVDDLGPMKIAVVKSFEIGVVGLTHHLDSPFGGTLVHVDSEADIRSLSEAVLREFGATKADVFQIATALK